jgi:hypothetical protein
VIARRTRGGYNTDMSTTPQWKYLVRKPKSLYKQLFVKDH